MMTLGQAILSYVEWKDPKTQLSANSDAGLICGLAHQEILQLYRTVQDLPRHLGHIRAVW